MSLKTFDTYKESEIFWLPQIPNHWTIERVKDFSGTKSGTTPSSSNNLYYENGTHNWIRTTDLNNGELYDVEYKITDFALEKCRLNFLPIDTVLVAMYGGFGTIGKNAILKKESTINQSVCAVLPSRHFNSSYFLYFLKYFRNDWKLFADGTRKDPNINQDAVRNLFVIAPPIKEQIAIANYLDTKTQAIDKKIELLEKKITYYQELSKSLINDTVTKGLKKSVVLEENELGFKTPASWQNYRLKDLGKLYSGLSGKSGDDFNQDNNTDNRGFIPFTNIASNTYLKKDHLGTVIIGENEKQNKVRKGDLFFLMSSEGYEDIGKTAALAEDIEETYLNSFCKGYRLNHRKCDPFFLNYLLLSDYYRQLLIIEGKGFTRINLKMEKVNDFTVIIPDTKEEQEEIVQFLDSKLDTITKIIKNIQTQITTLKELRKTLINDVVTGKIKVTQD
ncbi:MAG: restriction endonuclease subunit S [bacterium]|nr:restriction endonuclease subunit S [bacterium]